MYTTNTLISAMPATKQLAKTYQLNKVEYQRAFRLISQSHGITAAMVSAYQMINRDAQVVFLNMNFFPSSTLSGWWSDLRLMLRILYPSRLHNPIASTVQVRKNPGFRNPFFPAST